MGLKQVMILSTCNRSEIYYFYDDGINRSKAIQDIYCDMFEKAADRAIYQTLRRRQSSFLSVSSHQQGLESMVLGEDQILGQVKDALDFSRTMGFSKKELNKVVRDASNLCKKGKDNV